jgi:hypothetical protein
MHADVAGLGFPLWLRLTHYVNLLLIGFLVRSGIEILGARPRLYWNDGCTPGTAWLRLTSKQVPANSGSSTALFTLSYSSPPASGRVWFRRPGTSSRGPASRS